MKFKGKIAFITANVLLLLVDILHTLGLFNPPIDGGEAAVRSSMKNYSFDMGLGLQSSLWDVFQSLGFTMSIYMLATVVINIWLINRLQGLRDIKTLALFNASLCLALSVMYFGYQITPPVIAYSIVAVAFFIAFLRIKPS